MNVVGRTRIAAMLEKSSFYVVVVSLCFCSLLSASLARPVESTNGNFKLEEELNLQDKQPLDAQLQTTNGDYYVCVDIYKQPAFDNPLLKNHILQWAPVVYPMKPLRVDFVDRENPRNFTLSQQLCPLHHVPILKRKSRAKIPENPIPNNDANDLLYRFAILRMVHQPNENYLGAEARMTVDNPTCRTGQSSGAGIWIGSDLSDQKNFIKAGWMVDPDGYGDSQTRLSIYWTGDGFHRTGCYDLQCPGFVQISTNLILGAPAIPVSIFGGKQYEVFVGVFQDVVTKHWWLTLSNGDETLYIGYWPRELFPCFGDGGSVLYFGGRTATHSGQKFPSMGFGVLPDGDYTHSGIFREILYVNSTNFLVPPPSGGVEVHTDNPKCYGLTYKERSDPVMGHGFFMGGPGGDC